MANAGTRDRLDNAVLLLFALVTEAIARGTAALLEQDVPMANKVVDEDRAIDDRCRQVTELVEEAMSTPGLAGEDLEYLVAVVQIVPELERSADLAEHIARRTLAGLGGIINPRGRGLIQRMSTTATGMWRTVGNAYAQQSRDAVFRLAEADEELDQLSRDLVSARIVQDVEPQVAVDLALIARFYERLGDHAVNLARRIDGMAAPKRLSPLPKLDPLGGLLSPPGRRGGRLGRFAFLRRLRPVPTDSGFVELFRDAAVNARDCADELAKLVAFPAELEERYERVKAFEHRGDEITVELSRRLEASFVTPFDREDIHKLTEELDDVVDEMFAAASLIALVSPADTLEEMEQQARVLLEMADEMVGLMDALAAKEGARARLQQIERLEREGDNLYRRIMARLFSGDYEPLEVIKWKDIVQALEQAMNAVESVSDVVESILVKSS